MDVDGQGSVARRAPAQAPLFLDPLIGPALAALLDRGDRLVDLVGALGSPLTVLVPEGIEANRAAFAAVRATHHLRGRTYYASKASRALSPLRRLAASDAGADVASLGELQHALAAGFTGDRLIVTGPKTLDLLWLAARVGATVQVDSVEEARTLASLVRHYGLAPTPVMLRLSGFQRPGVGILSRTSRFGIPVDQAPEAVDLMLAEPTALRLVGAGCHLDTGSLEEKAAAVEQCLLTVVAATGRGLRPHRVDLGGGFGVRYLADSDQWQRYTTALTQAVLGHRAPMTWPGHTFGLRVDHGTVRGELGLYPAARQESGPAYLEALLRTPGPRLGRPLGTLLLEHLVEVDLEPGRAMLDQCGLTLARVERVGRCAGRTAVWLAANRGDLSPENGGVLMDPVVVRRPGGGHRTRNPRPPRPTEVFLLGNQCLENDLISHRAVGLRDTPEPGDLLAFVNTAGYLSDFHATGALRQPVARRVSVLGAPDCDWRWCLDEEYWPTTGVSL